LLAPILSILLAITVVGGVLVPFVWLGAFVAGLFGKVVILAALGRRLTRFFGTSVLGDVAFAVLFGGVIMLALYTVPILGFIAFKMLGILGLGVVVYTLLLTAQARRAAVKAAAAPAAVSASVGPTVAAAEAPAAEPSPAAATPEAAAAAPGAAPAPAASSIADSALPRAGFWIRIVALLIDVILIGIAFSLLRPEGLFLPGLAVYGAVMWKLKGTTVGGIVCNLKVVRVDGRELDWGTAAVRALSCFLSIAVFGLGFVWIAIDNGRQAWHDKIAGTAVVRVPQGMPLV
ncbi:MAG TPA: RDD family protein, partial [Povalibacter sp.]|nr:RDD family protein [Povalibacter sp.]